jgi:hypothetical protein
MTGRTLDVESVRDLGPQFVDNTHEMVGQDGAYSIPLNGDTLWFFGDTLIGERIPGESVWYPGGQPVGPGDMSGKNKIRKMINNTGALVHNTSGKDGITEFDYICDRNNELKQLVPFLADEHPDSVRIWCLHGITLNDLIYLYYIKVRMIAEGPFPVNFLVVGSGIAVGDDKDWQFRRIRRQGDSIFWNNSEPAFGTAVLRDGDDAHLYVYGVLRGRDGVQRCYIARVRDDLIEDRNGYEYLYSSEPSWSSDIGKAVHIFTGPPNELSVSYNKYLNCYLAVHSLDISGITVARTAPRPWGPWSEPVTLFTVSTEHPKPMPYPRLIYAAKEHPDLAEQNGKVIYITYIEFEEYFPHLMEVTFK